MTEGFCGSGWAFFQSRPVLSGSSMQVWNPWWVKSAGPKSADKEDHLYILTQVRSPVNYKLKVCVGRKSTIFSLFKHVLAHRQVVKE